MSKIEDQSSQTYGGVGSPTESEGSIVIVPNPPKVGTSLMVTVASTSFPLNSHRLTGFTRCRMLIESPGHKFLSGKSILARLILVSVPICPTEGSAIFPEATSTLSHAYPSFLTVYWKTTDCSQLLASGERLEINDEQV